MKTYLLGTGLTVAFLVTAPLKLNAEETIKVSYEKRSFDSKINSWVEGTIMTIDADAARLGVRGSKRVYASAYAQMLRDIDEKTDGLNEADRQAKEKEIRQKWATQLDAAHESRPEKEGDYTFYLPEKGKSLMVTDETSNYDLENKPVTSPVNVKTSDREQAAILAFKDLRVGQRIMVGYESGVIYNNAYVVIKTQGHKIDLIPADATRVINTPVDIPSATPLKSDVKDAGSSKIDNELLAAIRRSIVEDNNLSTLAHNVKFVRENEMLTLRGVVESAAEKATVEKKVAEYVGASHVVNQLDVQQK